MTPGETSYNASMSTARGFLVLALCIECAHFAVRSACCMLLVARSVWLRARGVRGSERGGRREVKGDGGTKGRTDRQTEGEEVVHASQQ